MSCANDPLSYDFNPTDGDVSIDSAFWMMWFAERAFFAERDEVRAELARIGFDHYATYDNPHTGLQYTVTGSRERVVVAFRGSTEAADWLANFDFALEEGTSHGVAGRVHRGFARAVDVAFGELERTVEAMRDRSQPIWFTGHSLGGAHAALAAARWQRPTHVGGVYTFGAPRAGDARFASLLDARLSGRVVRVVNERDFVPHLPPTAQAADAASRVLPFLRGAGANLVRALDYAHPFAALKMPDAAGTRLSTTSSADGADDEAYWREISTHGTLGAVASQHAQAARHAPQRYLCRLHQIRQAALAGAPAGASPARDEAEARARAANWALRVTRTIEAWDLVRRRGREPGQGVLIAHPDTGSSEHPELGDGLWQRSPVRWDLARDFVDGDPDPRHDFSALNRLPMHGHGTETSSVIVSPLGCPVGATEPCVTGAAPAASLIPLRITEAVILLSGERLAAAIDYAVDQGAHVISISLGGVTPMSRVEHALRRALDAGVIVVAAAGNNLVLVQPCTFEGVVCVAGINEQLEPWFPGSRGPRVDLSAPASGVRYARTEAGSPLLRYGVGLASGTSDATALTAAAAALWLSYHDRETLLARYGAAELPRVFRAVLRSQGVQRPPNWPGDGSFGQGVLDMVALLQAELPDLP